MKVISVTTVASAQETLEPNSQSSCNRVAKSGGTAYEMSLPPPAHTLT